MPPYITDPVANTCTLWNATLSERLDLYNLSEPTVFPELVTQVRSVEYWTRPGSITGGNRVWALWPARSNYGEISIEIPFMELADADLLRAWQFNDPPLCHFTNDGGFTVYKCFIQALIRKPFKYFQRQVMGIQLDLTVLGETSSISS